MNFFRCPAYYNLPPQCTLTKKTGECCLQPVCNFNPQYQTQTGQKVTNVNGVSEYLSIDIYWRKLHVFKIIQHIQIISVFKIHVRKSYIIQQCIPTKNNGIRNEDNKNSNHFSPFSADMCVYAGKNYYQGQTWSVGCEYDCQCVDAGAGMWSCQSK